MIKYLLFPLILAITSPLLAQSNVRAWYADGQVWIVWEASNPLPETYAVYSKPSAFTNTDNATLVGRLFKEEYGPAALREQVDSTATYRIPNNNGGIYQLADNEALFVATPHQAGSLFFAVVAWGDNTVTPGVNITPSAVAFQYDPVNDPVECHLQKSFISPFDSDYRCFAFYMWADGRQNQWENRPDFPVMANAAKNGMPGFFMISAPLDLDTTGGIPLSVWLHGGGGTARQSLAGSRSIIHLNPKQGILLAHNDDFFGYYLTYFSGIDGASKHFGWRKNYDPFTGAAPTEIDTIVNYTQRRYLWIDEWLIRNYNVDPDRININGHSMGSRGTTMMAKAFPDHYASATSLNNGAIDDDPPALSDVVYGPTSMNFPTNLTDYNGNTVPFTHAIDYTTRLSKKRDLPLMRFYHAKNDNDGMTTGNSWDADVVANFRAADSLAFGSQLNWSEREHGPDTGPSNNDHWLNGNLSTQQTVLDDIAYEEEYFRSDVSFPAFFNHRLDPQNNDPGTGLNGINNGDGDNWGTWGGYHRWVNVHENNLDWQTTAWLESNAVYSNDNCPNDFLTADLAIRKPRNFKPSTGTLVYWQVRDFDTNQMLQNGTAMVQADDLTVIPQVKVFRNDIRKVRIEVSTQTVATKEVRRNLFSISISPNPSTEASMLTVYSEKELKATLRLSDISGVMFIVEKQIHQGENHIPLIDFGPVPAGFYFITIEAEGQQKVVRWVKI
ncbi:MAG: T9SS type A sorting domain-containing protein [Saprospiraceae bacterium]